MDADEIQKHIETSVEPKMGEVSARGDRMIAEGVRALWEIALHLSLLNRHGVDVNNHF